MYRLVEGRLFNSSNCTGRTMLGALQDINLEIFKGDKVGVIGNNGAGKTTLLKVLSGLHQPSTGKVRVDGEVALLTALGMGMMDELEVQQNIFLYGAIHGMERRQIKEKLHDIVQWAELENFLGASLKALSSGMAARLAFSIGRHIEADIILLDEALTAGDKKFHSKCQEYFEDVKNGDRTFLIATHDLTFVETFCTKTLWLHKGQQMAFGGTDAVLRLYRDS